MAIIREKARSSNDISVLSASKKGFLFSMIALLLVSLFIVYFQISVIKLSQPAAIATAAQVGAITAFVTDLEKFYLPNLLAVSLRSSLSGITTFLAGGNAFISQSDQSYVFYELMTNGTIYPFNSTIFSNETLNFLLPQLTSLVNSELNIPLQINYTPYQFSITQQNPWSVTVDVLFVYTLNVSGVSFINKTMLVSSSVPITGLREPSFLINTHGTYSPNITQTNISTWTIAQFRTHIANQEFAENTNAPSYLNRLANITTSSPYGIEFFVNTTQFGFDVAPKNYSFVDYNFWTRPWDCTQTNHILYNITGISDDDSYKNFLLDELHAAKYLNVTERINNATIVCS